MCCEFPSTVSQSGGGGGGEFVGGARGTNSTKQAQVATQQGTGTRKLDSVTTHQLTTHSSVAAAAPLSDSQSVALPSQLPTRQQQQRNRQPPPKKVFLQVATTCSSSGKSLHTTAHESNPHLPQVLENSRESLCGEEEENFDVNKLPSLFRSVPCHAMPYLQFTTIQGEGASRRDRIVLC